ncbi:MAG TPA: putative peptidoglycan binding domain-containing protein, partial [Anaerolineales bacterium]|nr:putative peptidoglycan binding domain-containing protein [Anaerolineales bacterium]
LGELLEMHSLYFGKSPETDRVELKENTFQQMTEILTQTGYLKNGKGFTDAFNEFIGNENFEERADPQAQWIDGPVLEYLVRKFSK